MRTIRNWNAPDRKENRNDEAADVEELVALLFCLTTEERRLAEAQLLDSIRDKSGWIGVTSAKLFGFSNYFRAKFLQRKLQYLLRAPIAILRAIVVTALWPLFVIFDATEPLHWKGHFERAQAWLYQFAMMILAFAVLFAMNAAGPSIGL